MTLTIEMTPELQTRLQAAATREGLPVEEYARAVLEQQILPLALQVVALSAEEQDRMMAAAAEVAAEFYNADLALPPNERELTAFTALDSDDFLDPAGDG